MWGLCSRRRQREWLYSNSKMKIKDLPKVDRPRLSSVAGERRMGEKRMKKSCAVCGTAIAVILHVNRTYTGGHYFGKTPLHTKKEIHRAMKAGTHTSRLLGRTIQVMNKDPKPYRFVEYWECEKCYKKPDTCLSKSAWCPLLRGEGGGEVIFPELSRRGGVEEIGFTHCFCIYFVGWCIVIK